DVRRAAAVDRRPGLHPRPRWRAAQLEPRDFGRISALRTPVRRIHLQPAGPARVAAGWTGSVVPGARGAAIRPDAAAAAISCVLIPTLMRAVPGSWGVQGGASSTLVEAPQAPDRPPLCQGEMLNFAELWG